MKPSAALLNSDLCVVQPVLQRLCTGFKLNHLGLQILWILKQWYIIKNVILHKQTEISRHCTEYISTLMLQLNYLFIILIISTIRSKIHVTIMIWSIYNKSVYNKCVRKPQGAYRNGVNKQFKFSTRTQTWTCCRQILHLHYLNTQNILFNHIVPLRSKNTSSG